MKIKILALMLAAALLLSAIAGAQSVGYGSGASEPAKPVSETGRSPLPQQNTTQQQNVTATTSESTEEEDTNQVYAGKKYAIAESIDTEADVNDAVFRTVSDTSADVAEGTSYGTSSSAQGIPKQGEPVEVPGQASEKAPSEMDGDGALQPTEKNNEPVLPAGEKSEETQEAKPNIFVKLVRFFRGIFG